MPKQKHILRDWSRGMNSKKDPRDIADNESSFIQNMSIDAIGKLKTIGSMYAHIKDQDTSRNLTEYISERTANLVGSGGYGMFYFESDHSRDAEESITETKSGTALVLGVDNGNIQFVRVSSSSDEPPLSGE
jgi:hypothetical protein